MLLNTEFQNLIGRYNFTQDEIDLSAFVWAKAERAMQAKPTQEAVLLKEQPKFSTADIQAYYLGISQLPQDKAPEVITQSEAQFMVQIFSRVLSDLEVLKEYQKIIAQMAWEDCDGTEATADEFISLKRVLTFKERTKSQANKLANIQRKLKAIASGK